MGSEEVFVVYSTPLEVRDLAVRFEQAAAALGSPDRAEPVRTPARPAAQQFGEPVYSAEATVSMWGDDVVELRMYVSASGGLRTVEVRTAYPRRLGRTARSRRRALGLVNLFVFTSETAPQQRPDAMPHRRRTGGSAGLPVRPRR